MGFLENVISYKFMAPLLAGYSTRAAKSAVYRDCPRMLNYLQTAITAYVRNISQADLQKVFVNKIKCIQACINAHGRHFQHLYRRTATIQIHSTGIVYNLC
jgi:hypothetical protein